MPKFQRYLRLTEAKDYQRSKLARSYHGATFTCVTKTNDLGHPRLGLIVGKKVAPHANQRNKIKRIWRESFRHNHQELPQVDVILIAKRGITDLTPAKLRSLVDEQWRTLQNRK